MNDKSKEVIAKEKAAIDAMRNAKANMATALERIETLERGIGALILSANIAKKRLLDGAYDYKGDRSWRTELQRATNKAQELL